MKKQIFLLAFLFASCLFIDAQSVTEIFQKNRIINLVADDTYGVGNDWEKIFESYYDEFDGTAIGLRKKLVIYDDGKAIVSHATRNQYSLFDSDGKFQKDISLHFADPDRKPQNIKQAVGYINRLFFTQANMMGDIYFFDSNGLIVKVIRIHYGTSDILVLDDSHIAIYGSTSWGKKHRYFVSILDINTEKDTIIYDKFRDFSEFWDENGFTNASESRKREMDFSVNILKVDDRLLISCPTEPAIKMFDFQGNKISEQQYDWDQNYLSVDEQLNYQREKISYLKECLSETDEMTDKKYRERNIRSLNDLISRYEKGLNEIKEPFGIGWFTIAISGGDNIFFFDEAKEAGKNSFHVYQVKNGKTISENTLKCNDYDLAITRKRLVFHNGYFYGIQELKDCKGNPLRLVRFKVEAE